MIVPVNAISLYLLKLQNLNLRNLESKWQDKMNTHVTVTNVFSVI